MIKVTLPIILIDGRLQYKLKIYIYIYINEDVYIQKSEKLIGREIKWCDIKYTEHGHVTFY